MTTESAEISTTSIQELEANLGSTSSLGSAFEALVQKSMTNWSAFWHMMAHKEKFEEKCDARLSKQADDKDLRRKIKNKIHDLVSEEEVLLELYMTAAKAAKERQEELGEKIAALLEQMEKDKSFLRDLE